MARHAREADADTMQWLDKNLEDEKDWQNQNAVTKGPSEQEGGFSAGLFVRDKFGTKHEVYHYHDSEGSAHATLAPADAKLVIDKGWGERHVLSGQLPLASLRDAIPLTYIMIYAPRNKEELEVHRLVARSAVEWSLKQLHKGT